MSLVDHERPVAESHAPVTPDEVVRQQAVKQIERRRHYWGSVIVSGIGMVILAVIWAFSEYHNAGGWPTGGFSQSSGIHDVWNYWIVYPILGWGLIVAAVRSALAGALVGQQGCRGLAWAGYPPAGQSAGCRSP